MSTLWIQTFTGRVWQLDDPRAADVYLIDVAHALSLLCRYNGHTKVHYSVAQHCCLVHQRVQELAPGQPALALAGLLHDAHEAYLGDMTAPLKWTFRALSADAADTLRMMERSHDRAVAGWAGILPQLFDHPIVKQADLELLSTERRDLLGDCERPWISLPEPLPSGIEALSAADACKNFCTCFADTKAAIVLNQREA